MDTNANLKSQADGALSQPNRQLLTATEIAKFLNVPKSWIYQQTMRKSIPYLKIGKYLRFNFEEVLADLKSKNIECCGKDR